MEEMCAEAKAMKERIAEDLQFCCLISSSINYKLMEDSTWNSKITKRFAAWSTKFISHKGYRFSHTQGQYTSV